MKAFDYALAQNVSGALEALKRGYEPKAGGIDLLDRMKERVAAPDKIVAIHNVAELRGVKTNDDGSLWIGALTTLQDLEDHQLVRKYFFSLARSCGEAATPQVRAVATLAGNVLQRPRDWYWRSAAYHGGNNPTGGFPVKDGDSRYAALFLNEKIPHIHPSNAAPVLVALGAEVLLRGPEGDRAVPAGEFFVVPSEIGGHGGALKAGELITGFRFPAPPVKQAYHEIRHKRSYDWALASAAVARHKDGWRVVLGHVAPKPMRSEGAEKVLSVTDSLTPELATKAAEAAVEGATPTEQNRFRVHLAKVALRDALLMADGKEVA